MFSSARTLFSRLSRILSLTALSMVAAGGFAAEAPEAAQPLSAMDHTAWSTRDGAPGDVTAIAQTPDGFLWLGTSTGLYTFDGVRFSLFSPDATGEAIDQDISGLFTDASGALWIGKRFGGAYKLQDGKLTRFGEREGLPKHTLFGFAQERNGTLWAATATGIYRMDAGRWTRIDRDGDGIGGYVQAIVFDRAGTLWTAGANGVFYRPAGASTFVKHRVAQAPGLVMLDRAGAPWYFHVGGVAALGDDSRVISASALGSQQGNAGILLFDRAGTAWGTADGRIMRYRAPKGWDAPDIAHTLAVERGRPDWVASAPGAMQIFEDREGDIWMATPGGIDRFRENRLTRVDPEKLSTSTPMAGDDDAALWYLTDQDGLAKIRRGVPTHLGLLKGVGDDTSVYSFRRDRDGALWMGGNSRLWRYRDGALTQVALPFDDALVALQAMAIDGGGGLWISAVGKGQFRFAEGRWSRNGGIAGIPADAALTLEADGQGRLWMGFPDDRMAIVDRGHARLLDAADGLKVGNVLSLRLDSDRAWIGGSEGLMAFDGRRLRPVRNADGTSPRAISGIAVTGSGDLWLNSASGLIHATASQVARFLRDPAAPLEDETFNGRDGIDGPPPLLRPLPSAATTRDGRVWVTTSNGMYWIDSAHVRRNPVAPQVVVQAIVAEGVRRSPSSQALSALRASRLEFDYTAPSLALPERVQFSYRLDGLDRDWQAAGTRRQAFYTNVAPGTYTFRVRASNEDGVPSAHDATLTFTIPPAWWQTTWFVAAAALSACLVAWLLHRLRLRQVSKALHIRLDERERIARDLHDTLLQGTLGLVLGFNEIAIGLPPGDPRRQRMEGTLDEADRMLAEARQRVTSLRTHPKSAQALADSLADAAQALSAGHQAVFEMSVSGPPRVIRGDVSEEVFLFAREALANAFRHAHAGRIDLVLVFGSASLDVSIGDDGRGIPPEILQAGRPGRWGLPGLRERAARVGGRLSASSDSTGTRIAMAIPAAKAYAAARRRWREWFAAAFGAASRPDDSWR